MHLFTSYVDFISFDDRDAAMASITERAQRMEKELRETNAKHDRSAAELQVSFPNVRGRVRACVRARGYTRALCSCRYMYTRSICVSKSGLANCKQQQTETFES